MHLIPFYFHIFFLGTMEGLIAWLKDNLLQEREELFVQGKTV